MVGKHGNLLEHTSNCSSLTVFHLFHCYVRPPGPASQLDATRTPRQRSRKGPSPASDKVVLGQSLWPEKVMMERNTGTWAQEGKSPMGVEVFAAGEVYVDMGPCVRETKTNGFCI
jgi:hypothetical protein